MNNDLISIIIPVYNAKTDLSQCLESVMNQSYRNLEIICIDDGSTDGSSEILASYVKRDSRIRVITKINEGISAARNTGHEYVRGNYIMYLDSDDWIDLNTCEIALKTIKDTDVDVVFWNYIREFSEKSKPQYIYGHDEIIFESDEDIQQLYRKFFGPYKHELKNPEKLDSIATVWGKLYRADIILENKIKFVNTKEVGAEDLLFNIFVFRYVKKAVYLSACLNHYRKTNSTSFTQKYKKDFAQSLNNLYKHIEKHIQTNGYNNTYVLALHNRICLNIIGNGMNILHADKTINKLKELKKILSSTNYRVARKDLTLKFFPIHWKIFFMFAKYNCVCGVYVMLRLIKFLKEK